MNKKSFILMPLLACALTASAQINGNGGDFEQKPKSQTHRTNGTDLQIKTKNYGYEFSMGVRAGAGVSMMSEGDDLKVYDGSGISYGGTLSSSPEYLEVDNTRYKTGDLKGFDVKATVGLGYRFNTNAANEGFYVNARYYLGTSELAGNFPGKISSAELSIGYTFHCLGGNHKKEK